MKASFYIVGIVVIVILMLLNSLNKVKDFNKSRRYIEIYTNLLKGKANAKQELDDYLRAEKDEELLCKASIVKLYVAMSDDVAPIDLINSLNLKAAFLQGGKFDINKVTVNSDLFIWLILDLAKARSKSMWEVVDLLYNAVNVYGEELANNIEFQVFNATYMALNERGFECITFLKDLLEGNYKAYSYDKQLIGVFKKMAATTLVYMGEPIAEEDELLLRDFALTQVGNRMMKDLDVIDAYLAKEEVSEGPVEDKEEE